MRKPIAIILALMITAMSLTACGSGVKSSADMNGVYDSAAAAEAYDYGWNDMLYQEAAWNAEADWDYDDDISTSSPSKSTETAAESNRKIIKNGSMSIETLEFDRFIFELEASISAYGGYIESSSQSGNTNNRRASYTVRVPASNYDSFVNVVGEMGTVTRSDSDTDDVTLQYVDIEARLKALTAERDSFMALMDRAETIEDILKIQGYLTDVNYQIESYTSQLNTLKSLVSYSTVSLQIYEVERVTPPEPKTVWERISTNLSENLYDIGEGFKDFFVGFVSSIPYLIIYGVFFLIVGLIVAAIIKANKRKQQKRIDEYAKMYGQPPVSSENQSGQDYDNRDNK